jgi:hypothetical protein
MKIWKRFSQKRLRIYVSFSDKFKFSFCIITVFFSALKRATIHQKQPIKISQTNSKTPLNCQFLVVADLVRCVAIPTEACFKYALLIIHNILCGKGAAARQVVNFIRDERSLGQIAEWLLLDKNEKLLSIIVDIVQIVCDRNGEQKVSFFGEILWVFL